MPLLSHVRVRDFRSIRDASLRPQPVTALVGEANAGKSNLLAAIRAGLDGTVAAEGARVDVTVAKGGALPPVLFLPAELRTGSVVAPTSDPHARPAANVLAEAIGAQVAPHEPSGATTPVVSFVDGLERCCAQGVARTVLLIEEPELYLRPHAQRYLYRLLRTFAEAGNQVVYSTHSPAFLNVARIQELALVVRDGPNGTQIIQPEPFPATKDFRALSEFDAERSELFLARAALLVEGRTEKLVFPFVFEALGHDPDRSGISIVECGGKGNLPLFVRVCEAVRVPYAVVHDRDAPAGEEPIPGERERNELIARLAGAERVVELSPDFEGVAGLAGHSHKPERARARFAARGATVPEPLARAARLVLELARD